MVAVSRINAPSLSLHAKHSSGIRAELELTTTTRKPFSRFNVVLPQARPQFVDLILYIFTVPNAHFLHAPCGTPSGRHATLFVFPPFHTLLALGPPNLYHSCQWSLLPTLVDLIVLRQRAPADSYFFSTNRLEPCETKLVLW
jgi:hypothetical protein